MTPIVAASIVDEGQNAPIPPVLGPVSPSPNRLWSWQGGRIRMFRPSTSASTETSGPSSISSMTTRAPASPNSRCCIIRSSASSPSASLDGTTTPLPLASPAALITCNSVRVSRYCRAAS